MSARSRVVPEALPDAVPRRWFTSRRRFSRQPYVLVAVAGALRTHYPATAITARGTATRQRVLGKASELTLRRGIDATTVDRACQASSTSKTRLHQHFCDKEDLVRSVLNEKAQALLAGQRRELQEIKTMADLGGWRDRLVAANRQRGGAFGCVLGTMVSQLADRDEPARSTLAGYFAEWQHLAATALRRLQTTGELRRDADPGALATGLIAALQGGYVLTQASRDVDDMAAAIDMALNRIRSFAHAG